MVVREGTSTVEQRAVALVHAVEHADGDQRAAIRAVLREIINRIQTTRKEMGLEFTDRIAIGSGVVNNWTRNVGLLAATFSTLDDLAPGRVLLGIGAWWDPLAQKVGITRRRPLLAMRETVETTRKLLAMERVTFHGEFVDVEDIEIDIVHGDRSPKDVPIFIGATGMKMMELAGEIADGVVLNYLVSPAYNARAMEALAAGAARAGRTVEELDRPQLVVCSLEYAEAHGLATVPRFRDDFPIRTFFEDLPEPLPDDGVVVGQQDADHCLVVP